MKKLFSILAAASVVAALAGCGGGGDDSPPSPPATSAVPPSASASITGFIAYLQQLVVSSADTLEPVDVSTVTPPMSETDSPVSVD